MNFPRCACLPCQRVQFCTLLLRSHVHKSLAVASLDCPQQIIGKRLPPLPAASTFAASFWLPPLPAASTFAAPYMGRVGLESIGLESIGVESIGLESIGVQFCTLLVRLSWGRGFIFHGTFVYRASACNFARWSCVCRVGGGAFSAVCLFTVPARVILHAARVFVLGGG